METENMLYFLFHEIQADRDMQNTLPPFTHKTKQMIPFESQEKNVENS